MRERNIRINGGKCTATVRAWSEPAPGVRGAKDNDMWTATVSTHGIHNAFILRYNDTFDTLYVNITPSDVIVRLVDTKTI